MENDTDDLLQAEQAVLDVLKELEALKRQVGGYDAARQSLEGVRQALDSLIAKTSTLAEQTHAVTAALGKIGTPELLSRAESLKEAVAALAVDMRKQSERVRNVALASLIVSAVGLIGVIGILVKIFFR